MTVLDNALEFSDAQALASKSSGVATVSTDTIDMRTGLLDAWGAAKNPELGGAHFNVSVNVALVGAGAAIRCDLKTKASASSMASGTTIASITLPAVAPAGTRKSIKLPEGLTCLRYVAAVYTAVGAKLTSATLDAWLGSDAAELRND